MQKLLILCLLGPTKAWYLNFYSNEIYMYNNSRCYENSVRLVKK